MPLTQTSNIATALAQDLLTAGVDLEVFTEFPTDEQATSEGIYVARFYQEDRRASNQGVTLATSGSVYDVVDRLEMYLIQPQLNYNTDTFLNTVSSFIDNQLFVGYYKREYTVEQLYRKNNESYRIIFSLSRLQILT
jgi:hypothetical protein